MAADRKRRRRRAQHVPVRAAVPTAERMARAAGDAAMVDVDMGDAGSTVRVLRLTDLTPFERLFRRGVLDDRQHGAGARFWKDWYHAGLLQRTTSAYSDSPWPRGERAGMATTELQVLARQRLRAARSALGAHLGRVAEAILVDECDPADAGRRLFGRRDGPQARASATDALKIALDTLADHYGL
jgi:hypothetical protein